MPRNITTAEARVAWELYRLSGYTMSREEINAQAAEAGVSPVSDRTYRHFRSLVAAGFDHYVSINRFDILRASEPYENATAKVRYGYTDSISRIRVTVNRLEEPIAIMAQTTRVSDVGLLATIIGEDVVSAVNALRLKQGEYLRVEFLEGKLSSADCRLAERPEESPSGDSLMLALEFGRIRSVTEFVPGDTLSGDRHSLRLVADDGGPVAADVLGRRLYYVLEALEDARSLTNDLIAKESAATRLAAPPRIERLQMDSPLEVYLLSFFGVSSVVGVAWAVVRQSSKSFREVNEGRLAGAGVDRERATADRERAVARRETALAEGEELRNERLRMENTTLGQIHAEARRQLSQRGIRLNPAGELPPRFDQTAEQLIANLENLAIQGVTDLEIGPPSDSSDT